MRVDQADRETEIFPPVVLSLLTSLDIQFSTVAVRAVTAVTVPVRPLSWQSCLHIVPDLIFLHQSRVHHLPTRLNEYRAESTINLPDFPQCCLEPLEYS